MRQCQSRKPDEFEWEFKFSRDSIDFLDLHIFCQSGRLHTRTFTKPAHRPQYLHALSNHHPASIKGIYKAEAVRHEINSSRAEDYYRSMFKLKKALVDRGHPDQWLPDRPFSEARRRQLLERLDNRDFGGGSHRKSDDDDVAVRVPFVMTFSRPARSLGIRGSWKRFIDSLHGRCDRDDVRVLRTMDAFPAFKNSQNSFLITYRCNFAPG